VLTPLLCVRGDPGFIGDIDTERAKQQQSVVVMLNASVDHVIIAGDIGTRQEFRQGIGTCVSEDVLLAASK
jgi:predicted phosphodiesterase